MMVKQGHAGGRRPQENVPPRRKYPLSRIGIGLVLLAWIIVARMITHDVERLPDVALLVVAEIATLVLTVVVVDGIHQYRAQHERRTRLIHEMGSTSHGLAARAAEELRAYGWLQDGALEGADLWKANLKEVDLSGARLSGACLGGADLRGAQLREADLQEADLSGVDLRWADLFEANLRGALLSGAKLQGARNLSQEQCVSLCALAGATMPDGTPYDGRFNLDHDLQWARELDVDTDNTAALARWYGVSLEQYLNGQEWARENLPRLGGEPEQTGGRDRDKTTHSQRKRAA